MKKTLLLATFIFPERIEWYLSYLHKNFGIAKTSVFIYVNLDDESKVIVTFRLQLPAGKRIDLKEEFPNAVQIHKKHTTFYSINALNKLIEKETGHSKNVLDYNSYRVDWTQYPDQMILTNKEELMFLRLKKIF